MTLNSFLIHANSNVTAPPLCDHLLHMHQQAYTCCAATFVLGSERTPGVFWVHTSQHSCGALKEDVSDDMCRLFL